MKKKLLAVAAVALVISLCVGGTLAYYTAEKTAQNVITSGSIKIELNETDAEGKPYEDPEDPIVPGAVVDKVVTVENTGDNECWVRIRVEKAIKLADDVEGEPDLSLVKLDLDEENWTEKEGFFYYNEALKPGDETSPLFTTAGFDTSMDNMYQESTCTIDVEAQAVQKAHNGASAAEAAGWPESKLPE